jgi:methionyl aminopeptidase
VIIRKSADELSKMRLAGKVVAGTIDKVVAAVEPGITTADLDRIAETTIRDAGATPSFLGYRGFTKTICASVDDEIVHGIPSWRRASSSPLTSGRSGRGSTPTRP